MNARARRFEQVYRIHAWISMGLIALLSLRFLVFATFEDHVDDTWILGVFFAVGSVLWLWPHALVASRKSAAACLVCTGLDSVLGLILLWGFIGSMSNLREHGIPIPWRYLLFPAGMVIWVLSMAVMDVLYLRLCLGRRPENVDSGK